MIYTMEKLKYTSTTINVIHFESGLSVYPGINEIYATKIKNKVIARVDLISALSDCFSIDLLTKYRDGIIKLAQGQLNRDMIPDILTAFLEEDITFRYGINKLFNECPPDMTFGDYITVGLANRLIAMRDSIRETFTGRPEFLICESDGYAYISYPDTEGFIFDEYPCEVISYAKKRNS